MKIPYALLLICSMFLFGCDKQNTEFKVPTLTGRVVDQANVLSTQDRNIIESSIKQFEANTNGQIAVCVVKDLGGNNINDVSIKIAEKWKIGNKGDDNGLLLVWCPQTKDIRLEVGYGLEGILNDGKVGNILDKSTQLFKDGEYAKGIVDIISNCSQTIKPTNGNVSSTQTTKKQEDKISLSMVVIIGIVCIIIVCLIPGGADILLILLSVIASSGGFGGGGGSFGGGGSSRKY